MDVHSQLDDYDDNDMTIMEPHKPLSDNKERERRASRRERTRMRLTDGIIRLRLGTRRSSTRFQHSQPRYPIATIICRDRIPWFSKRCLRSTGSPFQTSLIEAPRVFSAEENSRALPEGLDAYREVISSLFDTNNDNGE